MELATARARRRRLLANLQGRRLEQAMAEPSLRADLMAEIERSGEDSLFQPEMLAYLDELLIQRDQVTPHVEPELFFSTDQVVIVPGFLASALADTRRRGRGLVWVHPLSVLSDRLSALRLGPYNGSEDDLDPSVRIEAVGPLPIFYDLLRLRLELARFTTEFFPFDWRRDLDIAASKLAVRLRELGARKRPLHVIAHSQGALVARRALQILGPTESNRLLRSLVLLGPANFGSFSAVLALAGEGDTLDLVRRLAVEPPGGFQGVLATMSGLYQLLPWDAERSPWLRTCDLGRIACWGANAVVDPLRLRRFLGWGRSVDSTFINDRTTIVLGDNRGAPTTGGVTLGEAVVGPSPVHDLPGDGTIPHAMAVLPGTRAFLVDGAEHSMLAAHRRVIEAVVDLLCGRDPGLPLVSSMPGDHLRHPLPDASTATGPLRRASRTSESEPNAPPTILQAITPEVAPPELNGRFLSGYDRVRARPGWVALQAETQAQDHGPSPSQAPSMTPEQTRPTGETRSPRTDRHLQAASPLGNTAPGWTSSLGPPCPRDLVSPLDGRPELILNGNNLLPFHFLREGDRLGRAVVKLQRADGASGTAFLVAPNVLLTNHHVLPDPEIAATTRALANYEVQPSLDASGRASVVLLDPTSLFLSNPDLDFAFCGVSGLEYLGVVPLERNSLTALQAENVNIVQHPGGRPKEVALQDNRVFNTDNLVIQYSCDTEPGSSGSPVFDNRWTLIALHHASVRADNPDAGEALSLCEPTTRYLNEGIRLSAIAAWLETHDAEQYASPEVIRRLRSIFRGLDPQIGFFGGLGRRGLGRSAAEMVVDLYNGQAGDLDLGFWNLESPLGSTRHRRAALARIIAAMGVDVWCLARIEAREVQALAADLAEYHQVRYNVLDGFGPLCILYRDDPSLTVSRLELLPQPFPAGIRVRTRSAVGDNFTLNLMPLVDPNDRAHAEVARWLAHASGQLHEPKSGPAGDRTPSDWMMVGGNDLRWLVSKLPSPSAEDSSRLVLAAGRAAGFVLVSGPGSQVDRLYVTPDVEPIQGPPGRVIVACDREMPQAARTFGLHTPIAVRLALNPMPELLAPTPTEPEPVAEASPATPAPEVSTAADSLESTLVGLLRPVIAKLLAEVQKRPAHDS